MLENGLQSDVFVWLCAKRRVAADGTGLARAIDYSLKRWPAILRYVESGQLPIDNNPIENAIRPICLGRRNWLFVGSERAGSALRPSRACWPPPASMDWKPTPGCAVPWGNSRPGPTVESMSCYRWAAW